MEKPRRTMMYYFTYVYIFSFFFLRGGGFPFYEEGDLLVFIHFYFSYEEKHEQK